MDNNRSKIKLWQNFDCNFNMLLSYVLEKTEKKPTFSLGNKVTLKLCNYFFSLSIDKKQIHKHTYRQRHRDIETYRHTDIQTYRHVNNNI